MIDVLEDQIIQIHDHRLSDFERIELTAADTFQNIVKELLIETYENLDPVDEHLLALETAPEDLGRISKVLRTIQTIKGTAGFLAFSRLEQVAHVSKSL